MGDASRSSARSRAKPDGILDVGSEFLFVLFLEHLGRCSREAVHVD